MMINPIQGNVAFSPAFDTDTTDTATDKSIDLTSQVNAQSQLHVLDQHAQTTVTDPVGAASDACMGTCKLVGAATGGVMGFAAGNGPGAVVGISVGYTAGDIIGEFVCDPRFAIGDPVDFGTTGRGVPDAGVTDSPSTGGVETPGDDAVGGLSLSNGGVESNAGITNTSGEVSIDSSGSNPPSSSGTDDNSSGVSGTDDSNTSAGTDSPQDPDAGLVDGSNGSGDLPPDDGGGDVPIDPRRPYFNPSLESAMSLSSLTTELNTNGLLTSAGLGLSVRA